MRVERHLGRRRPRTAKLGDDVVVPAAAGLRQRPEDRWRFLAVGRQRDLRQPRGRHGLPEVRVAGQVRRASSPTPPATSRPPTPRPRWSRATRRAGPTTSSGSISKKFAEVRPADPGVPVHRDHLRQGGAGHHERRRPAGRRWTRRSPTSTPNQQVQQLLPVTDPLGRPCGARGVSRPARSQGSRGDPHDTNRNPRTTRPRIRRQPPATPVRQSPRAAPRPGWSHPPSCCCVLFILIPDRVDLRLGVHQRQTGFPANRRRSSASTTSPGCSTTRCSGSRCATPSCSRSSSSRCRPASRWCWRC